ncbi:AMP-binding enzyme [Flavobacterium sp. GB2R13]|uniref:AMP-binding enzyme n=1 Tax=Flavobacterium algoris TaxID=3398733 RepID=UPI003A865D44
MALDKHIQDGYGDQIALIYDSPVTQTVKKYTFFEVKAEVVKLAVRQQIGTVASLRNVVMVDRLLKTRSGKTLRKLMRSISDGENYQIPSTIDDESIVDEIKAVLKKYEIGVYNTK